MSNDFDPYFKWLGIAPKDQPPNCYRLLGLDLFIDDPDVISNAADRQMMILRTFQAGPYGDLSQRLLNEIATARACLLDPRRKAEYDRQLQLLPPTQQPAPPAVPMGVPATRPAPLPTAQPEILGQAVAEPRISLSPPEPRGGAGPRLRPSKGKRHNRNRNIAIAAGVIVVAGIMLFVLMRILGTGPDETAKQQGGGEQGGGEQGGGPTTQGGASGAANGESQSSGDAELIKDDFLNWKSHGNRRWIIRSRDNEVSAAREMSPGSWLLSEELHDDFVLTGEFLLERKGAGGVYLRVPTDAMWPWNQGVEVHFKDDYGEPTDHESTGAIWHRAVPRMNAVNPANQWNTFNIECRGRDIDVTINDMKVTAFRIEDSMPLTGHVGLDGVSGGITYRNLQLRRRNSAGAP